MMDIAIVPSSVHGCFGPSCDLDVASSALVQLPKTPYAVFSHRIPLGVPGKAFAADRASGAVTVLLEL